MAEKIFNLRVEKRWRSIPKDLQKAILSQVWCGNCLKGTAIKDWEIVIRENYVVIDGQCSVCGDKCARVLEED